MTDPSSVPPSSRRGDSAGSQAGISFPRPRQSLWHASTAAAEALDAVRLKLGGLPLQPIELDACALLQPLVSEPRSSRRTPVMLNLPGDELRVRCDPERMGRVVYRLSSYLRERTPVGERLYVRLSRQRDEVIIALTAPSLQLASREWEYFFRSFRRPEPLWAPFGTLGVAVARAVVLLHGGRVLAQGLPGLGLTVSVCLPAWGQL